MVNFQGKGTHTDIVKGFFCMFECFTHCFLA